MPLRKSHFTILIAVLLLAILLGSSYLASRAFIPVFIQKNGKALLGVPVRVQSGGFNLLNATFWLDGLEVGNVAPSRERLVLSVKRFELDLSFTSFLANQLIIENIRLTNPVLNLERNAKGDLNLDRLTSRFRKSFKPHIRMGHFKFFSHYAIRHFSIKNGTLRHYNQGALSEQKEWLFREIDFSFSEFDYPPELDNPVTTSLYFGAKLTGQEEGRIRILGSGSFISNDKNFRLRSTFQNISLRDLNILIPNSAYAGLDGLSDIESSVNCERNLMRIENKIKLRKVSLPQNGSKKVDEIIFGFSRETLTQFFKLMGDKPFEFNTAVSGKLTDASFDLKQELIQSFFRSAHEELNKSIDKLNAESLKPIEKLIAGQKSGAESNPAERFKQMLERFSEKKPSKPSSGGLSSPVRNSSESTL